MYIIISLFVLTIRAETHKSRYRSCPLQSVLYLGERGEEIEQAKLMKYRIIIIIFS